MLKDGQKGPAKPAPMAEAPPGVASDAVPQPGSVTGPAPKPASGANPGTPPSPVDRVGGSKGKFGDRDTTARPDEFGMLLLKKAAHDTRILLSYLSRREWTKLEGVDVDPTLADRITGGEYSRELEDALWEQLGRLSDAARPASPESISDSRYFATISGSESDQKSKAGGKLRWVRGFAFLALTLTFLLGVFVSITSTAVTQARADLSERRAIILGNYEGTRAERTVAVPSGDDQPSQEAATQRALVDIALKELQGEIRTGYALIMPVWLGASPEAGTYDNGDDEYALYNVVFLDIQENLNQILENFLIPMLAAFLGVAVYIIRDTNLRLENVALSPMDAEGYWPRILLGMVAGLTIGWLTPTSPETAGGILAPDAIGVLQNLSKAALAFVVGYSIEVLFNILDAIKLALGVREDRTSPREQSNSGT